MDRYDRLVSKLRPGTLLHLDGKLGKGRVIVAWISPSAASVVLNSDACGLATVDSGALAMELRSGHASVVSNPVSPIDRILGDLSWTPQQCVTLEVRSSELDDSRASVFDGQPSEIH